MAAGQGVGGTSCPTATDDPGLVLSEVKVVAAPTQPAFPGRELRARQWAGRYAWIRSWEVPREPGDFHIVHPCRDKSFRKAVSAVMDDLVTDSEIINNFNGMIKNWVLEVPISRM